MATKILSCDITKTQFSDINGLKPIFINVVLNLVYQLRPD